jgi:hypothetical protein
LSGFTHPSVRHYPDKKIYIFMDRRDRREGAGEVQEGLNDDLYERFENGRSSADE